MKTLAIILLFVLLYFAVGALIGYFAYLRPLSNEKQLDADEYVVASTFGFLLIILFWPVVLLLVGISDAIDKAREFSADTQLCDYNEYYDEGEYYDEDEDENTDAL